MLQRFTMQRMSARSVAAVVATVTLFSAATAWTGVSSPRAAAAGAGTQVQVQMKNFAFDPPAIVITAGQTLVWSNDDVVPHTATANAKTWDSGQVGPGHSFKATLTKPGTYDYRCTIHTFMHARVVVMK